MEHDVRTTRADGVTFVAVTVANDGSTPRRVRVENALDGPVWPPRTNGVPEEGWSEVGFETVLAPGERRGVGYATPAPPTDPAVTVTATDVPDGGDEAVPVGGDGDGLDPVRGLGDPRPPRDALGDPPQGAGEQVPDAAATWLDDVATRLESGDATAGDRTALARAARLHERAGGSPVEEFADRRETGCEQ